MLELRYVLNFKQAKDIVKDGGFVTGESFAEGVFMTQTPKGKLCIVDTDRRHNDGVVEISQRVLHNQRYAKLSLREIEEITE